MSAFSFIFRQVGLAFFLVCATLFIVSIDSIPLWISLVIGAGLWVLMIFGDWTATKEEVNLEKTAAVNAYAIREVRDHLIFDQDEHKGENER